MNIAKIKQEEERLFSFCCTHKNFTSIMLQDFILEFNDKYEEEEKETLPDIVLNMMYENIINRLEERRGK